MKGDSKRIRQLLRSKDKFEALAWLRDSKYRNVGEMENGESIALVEELYALGATEVLAVEIGRTSPYESTDILLATLPDDARIRQALFAWDAARVREMGYDPEVDVGQQHMFIWFD